MAIPRISIPKPCAQPWDAMTPTAAGRHCAACQTEVVDFTRLSDAEVLAFMAARQGQRVCGYMAAPPVLPADYKRNPSGWRRWLLAAAVLLGWRPASALGLPPQEPPVHTSLLVRGVSEGTVTIRGVVLDDSLNVPVRGAYVFIGNTKYGAITNEKGEFALTFTADWEPAKSGVVKLEVARIPFALLSKAVMVNVAGNSTPAPVTIRLVSVPGRGFIKGKAVGIEPPVPLPGSHTQHRESTRESAITIRGVVLDDSLNVPVRGAYVFIGNTKYGAITDEKGEFTLTFAADWEPAKSGVVKLEVATRSLQFVFSGQTVAVNVTGNSTPSPVTIRLASVPGRGFIKGEAEAIEPPVPPPGSRKTQR